MWCEEPTNREVCKLLECGYQKQQHMAGQSWDAAEEKAVQWDSRRVSVVVRLGAVFEDSVVKTRVQGQILN